jgi:hypothetical protein
LYGEKYSFKRGNIIRQIGTSQIDIQISKTNKFYTKKELNIQKNPNKNVYKKIISSSEKGKSVIMIKLFIIRRENTILI